MSGFWTFFYLLYDRVLKRMCTSNNETAFRRGRTAYKASRGGIIVCQKNIIAAIDSLTEIVYNSI